MENNNGNPSLTDRENWAFFGTDEFSVAVLDNLKQCGLLPDLIITVPDQAQGRRMILTPPPVKIWGDQNQITVVQPASLKVFNEQYSAYNFTFALVASYGKIIPQSILDRPEHGTLNIHPSLLPKYRGATPLESAILDGADRTGVTIIKLDAEMDHGPIVAQKELDQPLGDLYYDELRGQLAELGARLLAENIKPYLAGALMPKEQDHSQATFTKKLSKEEGLIKLEDEPAKNYRKIRALTPWPGVFFFMEKDGQPFRVVIKKARLEHGELIIERVVPAGKKEMDWESFKRGYLRQ